MPLLRTTPGQLLVNSVLPPELVDYNRVLDKKGLKDLLYRVATEHPERYREVSHALSQIGWKAAQRTGGYSFGLESLRKSRAGAKFLSTAKQQIDRVLSNERLSDQQRDEAIVRILGGLSGKLQDAVLEESLAENNPLARQVMSGSRGNKMNLSSLRGSDLLYVDHRDRAIPFPIYSAYGHGLIPSEYWASTYGARKGVVDVKTAVRDAGSLGKQLVQIVHRQLVTDQDAEDAPPTLRGYPVDTDDQDNEGALLAYPAGGYERNTVLTPKVLSHLRQQGIKRLLVRSPIAAGSPDGGLYARDVGVREFGRLPARGENVSVAAVQALNEPLSQGALSSKHSGGVAGAHASKAVGGFDVVNQLVQAPKVFKGGAAHAEADGLVTGVEPAPAGGQYVYVDGQRHYVHQGFDLLVKRGDRVEAGDVISEGLPNPALIVKHKGVGDGRRYFVEAFRKALADANMQANRRNIELLARGLINHVQLTEESDDGVPDDVVPYHQIEHNYEPRPGFRVLKPKDAVGKYLERPYLHHSIGAKIRPRMLEEFEQFGVRSVDVHDEPPPFEPVMVRGMANLQHDPDWLTRLYGSGLKRSLLQSVHRGGSSDPRGTSFVPGLAQAHGFGEVGKVVTPQAEEKRVNILGS